MVSREEFLTIILLASHLAHSDGDVHPLEKKVMASLLKSLSVTPEERATLKKATSLEAAVQQLQSAAAKDALVDVLVLIASADGNFEEEEKTFIKRVMLRLAMEPDAHPYFQTGGEIDLQKVRHNVKTILEHLQKLSSSEI